MATEKLRSALPSETEANAARESSLILASRSKRAGPLQLRIVGDAKPGATLKLPDAAVDLLATILDQLAQGNAVAVVPVRAELTTQQAADVLRISRPSLIQLLDNGKINFRLVGTHRRVQFESVLAFKRQADTNRRAALDELVAYDQKIGI